MDIFRDVVDIGFDFERAKTCAEVYSKSVNCECFIIDCHGSMLYNSGNKKGICSFCKIMQQIMQYDLSCANVHLYGSYQAERFGGKYVFFCPMGLVHWASPIVIDGTMKGAILGGPILMVDREEFLMDDIVKKHNVDEASIGELRYYLEDIPFIQPDVVNSMSELLFIVSSHLSNTDTSILLQERDFIEQQSDISEYIHIIKTMGGNLVATDTYPIDKERELLKLIALGDKQGSQKVLNEIFGHIFFSTGGNFEIIKARVLELVVLLSRAALEGGADVELIFGLNYKFLGEIHEFKTIEELTYWLSKIMARFTDCVFNLAGIKHVDVIYKATDYIKKNYMKKMTLEDVASHVFLSPSYFSKVFKDEMKYNFNVYLNNVRIDMSKKLLADEKIALVDVSNLVGFEDQSYFTKVFKKITGVSPGKYRESRGTMKS